MKGCIYLDQEDSCWPITNALEMMNGKIESTEILGAAVHLSSGCTADSISTTSITKNI